MTLKKIRCFNENDFRKRDRSYLVRIQDFCLTILVILSACRTYPLVLLQLNCSKQGFHEEF